MFEIELIICVKMGLVLNNLQRLICHKTQTTKHILGVYNCNLSFLQPLDFFHMLLFISLFKRWGMNNEHQAINKPKIFDLVGKNYHKHMKYFCKPIEIHIFEWHKRFKEGCEELKDNSRSGRPSTSRTEVNVKRIRQVVCDNHWLTVVVDSVL